MSISNDDTKRIARLARIHVRDSEIPAVTKDLDGILHWIDQLQSVDVSGVQPYSEHVDHDMPERADVIDDGDCVDQVLSNAPEAEHGMYAVPKVIE